MQSIFTQSIGQSGLVSPKIDQTLSPDSAAVRSVVGNSVLPTFNVVFEEAVEADLRNAGPQTPEADVQGDTSAETDTPKPASLEAPKADTKPQSGPSITDEESNRLTVPDTPFTQTASLLMTEQNGRSEPSKQAAIATPAPWPVDGLDHKMDVSASPKAMSASIDGHPQPEVPLLSIPTTIPQITNTAAMMNVTQARNTQAPAHVDFFETARVLSHYGMQSNSLNQPPVLASSSVGLGEQASSVGTSPADPAHDTVQTLSGKQVVDIVMQPPVGPTTTATQKSTTLLLDQNAMPTREALPNANILQKAPTPLAASKTTQKVPLVGGTVVEQVTAPTLNEPAHANRTGQPQNAGPLTVEPGAPMRFTKPSEGEIIKMPNMAETSKAGISVSEARLQTVPIKTPAAKAKQTPQMTGGTLQNPDTSASNARSPEPGTPNSTQALDTRPQTVQIDKQVLPNTLHKPQSSLPLPQADPSKLTGQPTEIGTPQNQVKNTTQNAPVSPDFPHNSDTTNSLISAGRTPLPASELHIKKATARTLPNAAASTLENAVFVSRTTQKNPRQPQLDVVQIAANRQVAQPDTETTLHQVIRLKGAGPIAPKDAAVLTEKAAKTHLRTPVRADQLPAFTPPQTATSQIVAPPKPEPKVFGRIDGNIPFSQPVIITNSGFAQQLHAQEEVSNRRAPDEPRAAPPSTNYTQAAVLNQAKATSSMALQPLAQSANFNQSEEKSRPSALTHSDPLTISRPDALQTAQAQTIAAATRMDLAPHVSRQVMEVVQHLPNKPVEISLNPDELGRLRLAVSTSDAGLVVSVVAERPETLDLLRKHISLLGQEFQALGYDDVAFSFNGNGDFEDNADTGQENTSGGSTIITAEPELIPRDTPVQKPIGETGLDLRL